MCEDARRLLGWPPNVPYTYPSKLPSSQRELIAAHYRASHPAAFPEAAGSVAAADGPPRPPRSDAAGAGRAGAGAPVGASVGGQDALAALDIDAILALRRNGVQCGPVLDAVREEQRQSQAETAAAAAREADALRAGEEQRAAERQAAALVAERQAMERQGVALAAEQAAAVAAASEAPSALNQRGSGARKRGRPTKAALAERAAAEGAQGGADDPLQDEVEVRTSRGRQIRQSAWRTGGQ